MWSSYLILFFYHLIKDFISNWKCSAKETAPWKEPHSPAFSFFNIRILTRRNTFFPLITCMPWSKHKQPLTGLLWKISSEKIHKAHRKASALEPLFSKVAGMQRATLLKRDSTKTFLLNTSRRLFSNIISRNI